MRKFKIDPRIIMLAIVALTLIAIGGNRFNTDSENGSSSGSPRSLLDRFSGSQKLIEDELVKVGSEVCEERGGDLFIENTFCPCPEDPGLASVCGHIKSTNIIPGKSEINANSLRTIYTARPVLGGVTVAIYENNRTVSSGKPFGNLEQKLVECESSEVEGKYFCYMRRITPGMQAYVIFACSGQVADIKIINSARSLTTLNSDVDCTGNQTRVPLPDVLDFANRDTFLGCTSSEPDRPNPSVGFKEKQEDYTSVNVGELGITEKYTGDTRFIPLDVLNLIVHPGALFEQDCLITYFSNLKGNFFSEGYDNVLEKCNYDPGRTNKLGLSAMEDIDELTTPFRYDVPTYSEEIEQVRVFETRTELQRVLESPTGPQQFAGMMFGECSPEANIRYVGDTEEVEAIPCEYLRLCNDNFENPYLNQHTNNSMALRLGNPASIQEVAQNKERDPEDVICKTKEGVDVKLKEIETPFFSESSCGSNCKLGKEYYNPSFIFLAGGSRIDKTSETMNDTYGETVPRDAPWDDFATEATNPHKSGNYVIREVAEKRKGQNSLITASRISSSGEDSGLDSVEVFTNNMVSHVDGVNGVYDYSYDHVIFDVGGNVQSFCTVSSVAQENNNAPVIYGIDEEQSLVGNQLISNFFLGDLPSHKDSKTAGTATFASPFGQLRDEALAENSDKHRLDRRDFFDSFQRFRSGGGGKETNFGVRDALSLVRLIVNRAEGVLYKSFAERVENWTDNNTPAVMDVTYCMSEESLSEFPPYGSAGYGEFEHACYPWGQLPVDHGDICGVWPGPRGSWPDRCNGSMLESLNGQTCPFELGWPGLGELRTCRIVTGDEGLNCKAMHKERQCKERDCTDFNGDGKDDFCTCEGGFVIKEVSSSCNQGHIEACLSAQLDTWDHWDKQDSSDRDIGWSAVELPRDDPSPELYKPTRGDVLVACDLEKAGPMQKPGDIKKTLGARLQQEPLHGEEDDYQGDGMVDSFNVTNLSFNSIAEERKYGELACFGDFASTNDLGIEGRAAIDGPTHLTSAGIQCKGQGVGNIVGLQNVVASPEYLGTPTEDYPPIREEDKYCDVYDQNVSNWCRLIEPPSQEIDLDEISGGACDLNLTSCNIPGVGDLASRILGSAGANSGVPGSLLLAVIVGEGGWLDETSGQGRLQWDDDSIARYSEPWFARMPNCNEMTWSAQGPFGLITKWYSLSVWGTEVVGGLPVMSGDTPVGGSPNGFHPSRVNSSGGVISSKCNFIDAAYAAAKMLAGAGAGAPGCSMSESQVRTALAGYRGGSGADADAYSPDFLVDIAMRCQ